MKISYNWLKEYLDFDENHESIGNKLTSLGLEVEGIAKFESIPGGLKGVVVGKTRSIKKHPNADRLKITTVDIVSLYIPKYLFFECCFSVFLKSKNYLYFQD